jgi:hypothetical protein
MSLNIAIRVPFVLRRNALVYIGFFIVTHIQNRLLWAFSAYYGVFRRDRHVTLFPLTATFSPW